MLTDESLSLNLRRSVVALRAAALVLEAEVGDADAASCMGRRFTAVADMGAS